MKTFYCDGSTRGKNQRGADNVGGWGVVCFGDCVSDFSFDFGISYNTTNNREELKALIFCLSTMLELYPGEKDFIIYSDSAYVVNCANQWIDNWARNGWCNSKKQPVENLDLVQELYELLNKFCIQPDIRKCEGHAGEIGNELADALATADLRKFMKLTNEYDIVLGASDYEWLEVQMRNIALGENR